MKSLAILGLALSGAVLISGVSQARPLYIEESAVLTPPSNGFTYSNFGFQAATNGEYALVAAERADTDFDIQDFDALLYRRTSGGWQYVRILASGRRDFNQDDRAFPVTIAMKGTLASTELGDTRTRIFRFGGSDWLAAGAGETLSEGVSIDGDRILYGVNGSWAGRVFEPNGSGGWTTTRLDGQPRCCDDEFWGGPVDLLGDHAVHFRSRAAGDSYLPAPRDRQLAIVVEAAGAVRSIQPRCRGCAPWREGDRRRAQRTLRMEQLVWC